MKSCVTISLVEQARGGPFVFSGDLEGACRTAGEMGFDAVEIFAPGPAAIDAAKLRALLSQYDLSLAAVGTGGGWVVHRLQLADGNAARRQAAVDYIKSMIDFGAGFGAPAIIGSMQGRSGDDVSPAAASEYLREGLEQCAVHARGHGLPLLYEPLNRYETNQVNTVADGMQLLAELSCRNVKLLCDLFHMQIEERDLPLAIRQAADHIGHVHFADSNRRAVGFGHFGMHGVISALREIGYRGYLSAEVFPWPDSRRAAERTIAAFRHWAWDAGG